MNSNVGGADVLMLWTRPVQRRSESEVTAFVSLSCWMPGCCVVWRWEGTDGSAASWSSGLRIRRSHVSGLKLRVS